MSRWVPGRVFVSALPRHLPWTHNLIILSESKRAEEREFYLRMAVQERWSTREPERKFKAARRGSNATVRRQPRPCRNSGAVVNHRDRRRLTQPTPLAKRRAAAPQ